MQVRFLPYFKDSVGIENYIKNADKFFKKLPPVCPFCGWIGDNPLSHGYNTDPDWVCPIRWLALNVRHLHAAKYIEFPE